MLKKDSSKNESLLDRKITGNIPYVEILKKSFHITWKNKLLWWFGFLIALSSPGSVNINLPWNNSSDQNTNQQMEDFWKSAVDFYHQYILWIILSIAIIAILFLALYILGKIARGALIKSVNKIDAGEKIGFKAGITEGKKYFWKILGLDILLSFSLTILVLIIIAPSLILFFYKAYVSGILLILLAIVFIIALSILASFLRNFSHIYIVLADLSVWNSIERAYDLFRKNIWPSILMALLLMAVGLGLSIIFIFAIFIFIILSVLLGLLVWALAKTIGIIIFGTLAGIILLIAIFIARSALEVFYQASWILFFKEIATQPKKAEPVLEPVLKTNIETKPSESVNLTKN